MKKISLTLLKTTIITCILLVIISLVNYSYGTNSSTNGSDEKDNNYLSSLSVEGYELSPEFNKYAFTYYLVVPTDVTSLVVNAETENEKATKRITGNTKISNKENTIKVSVTSQNRTVRTYNIIVTKQAERSLTLTELSIEGVTLNEELSSSRFEYSAELKTSKEETDLNITAVPSVEGATVEIVGDKGLENGSNLVTIILKNGSDITTYQITVNITVEKTVITQVENNDFVQKAKDFVVDFFKDENKTIAFLVGVAVVLFLLVIVFIIKIKNKNKAEKNRENLRKRAK